MKYAYANNPTVHTACNLMLTVGDVVKKVYPDTCI